jgi:predicted small lipoprotein YifL
MSCWTRRLFLAVVAILGTGQMLAACGQKGNLYLVKEDAAKATPATKPGAAKPPAAKTQPQGVPPSGGNTQGPGESLGIMDEVPSATPDVSGM